MQGGGAGSGQEASQGRPGDQDPCDTGHRG